MAGYGQFDQSGASAGMYSGGQAGGGQPMFAGGGGGGTMGGGAQQQPFGSSAGGGAQPGVGQPFAGMAGSQMAGLGASFMRQQMQSSMGRLVPGASALWQSLRYYFAVDNSYMVNKMRLLVFPWQQKSWGRQLCDEATLAEYGTKYEPAVRDVNAPDMYIPVMSLITYVLVCGLAKGTNTQFNADTLSEVAWTLLGTQMFEVGIYKLGLYVLNAEQLSTLDLVAFSGYKFFGMTLNMLVGLLLGRMAYYVVLLYTAASMFRFMTATIDKALSGPSALSMVNKRKMFFVGVGAIQMVLMWFLAYSGDLAKAEPVAEVLNE